MFRRRQLGPDGGCGGSTGMGSCTVTYRPSEVSGVEMISASADGFPSASAQIRVAVPGLMNLAEVFTNFFRLTGQTTLHPDNHWGTEDTLNNIQLVALDFFEASDASLRINDMSLPLGGMFDICGTWNPSDTCPPVTPRDKGHVSHRKGTSVDIGRTACKGLVPEATSPPMDCPLRERISVARLTVQEICFKRDRATMA